MFKGATMSLDTLFGSVPTGLHVLKHSKFIRRVIPYVGFACILLSINVPNQNLTGRNVGIMVEHRAIVFQILLLCTYMQRRSTTRYHRVTKSD
jgi:hypothetical protein